MVALGDRISLPFGAVIWLLAEHHPLYGGWQSLVGINGPMAGLALQYVPLWLPLGTRYADLVRTIHMPAASFGRWLCLEKLTQRVH
jgi:hypothetical protein